MNWVNPLDKVPQIRVDWANHIAQGGLWSCVLVAMILVVLHASGLPIDGHAMAGATRAALIVMTVVAFGKKAVDWVNEGESALVCFGKGVVTVLWPATLAIAAAMALH